MMDSFELLRDKIEAVRAPEQYGLEEGHYGVVTLHRPSNVDEYDSLKGLVDQLVLVAKKIPLIFAVHPRTRNSLQKHGLWDAVNSLDRLKLVDPVSYAPFMSLVKSARLIITDSGGIQEEATYLDIPCLTLRENTERPITVSQGTNRLVTTAQLPEKVDIVLEGKWPSGTKPDLWDGKTAQRIVKEIRKRLF